MGCGGYYQFPHNNTVLMRHHPTQSTKKEKNFLSIKNFFNPKYYFAGGYGASARRLLVGR
jgi:hypothetical protein